MILIFLFLLLTLFYAWFLSVIFAGLKKLSKSDSITTANNGLSLSVIIPFRNESENILNSLRCIEAQDLSKDRFEVLFVNDSSDDDSLEKIYNSEKSPNIKILSVPKEFYSNGHKKRAIRYALEHATGDIIVSTDCDCLMDNKWLSTLVAYFDEDTAFVSGPVAFIAGEKLSDKLQSLEFSGLVLAGAGLIGASVPMICNAANMAYKRSVFNEIGGYDDNLKLSSGDDELLMQKIAAQTSYKIKFCLDKDALVKTYPNRTLDQFYNQRKRWASKGLFYLNKMVTLKLFFIFLFYLSIPVQLLLGIFYSNIFLFSLLFSMAMKLVVEYFIMAYGLSRLSGKSLMRYFVLAELLHVPYIIIAAVSGAFGNYKWKARKLKR